MEGGKRRFILLKIKRKEGEGDWGQEGRVDSVMKWAGFERRIG